MLYKKDFLSVQHPFCGIITGKGKKLWKTGQERHRL